MACEIDFVTGTGDYLSVLATKYVDFIDALTRA